MSIIKQLLLVLSIFIVHHISAQVSDFKGINFSKADNIAKLNGGKSLDNLSLLVHNLTSRLDTDVEKFRSIYMWVCNNIEGDMRQTSIVSRKRKKHKNDSLAYINWNNDYKEKAFKTLLKHKKTMCTGYAYLIKELCFLANIESEIISGYGRTVESNVKSLDMINHSWNAVKLNNKWYVCDATWSSGYTLNSNLFIKSYNDGYFLADPILFGKTHFPIDKKWLLNDRLSQSEFVAPPLIYGETFEHQIIPICPAIMDIEITTNDFLNFSFKTEKPIADNQIKLVYFSGNNERTLDIVQLKIENGMVTFKHQFKNKGLYDVHLKIGDAIVATYTIRVIKADMEVVSACAN